MGSFRCRQAAKLGNPPARLLPGRNGCYLTQQAQCIDPEAAHFLGEGGQEPAGVRHRRSSEPFPACLEDNII
eukprot:4588344-Prorocentrum_lima.AAC.1